MRQQARGFERHGELPFDPAARRTLRYWHNWQDRQALLEQIKQEVVNAGWRLRLDSGWDDWDMEIYGSRYVKIRLRTASDITTVAAC